MSVLEDTLALHLKSARLPLPQREYVFHPTRKWRLDFAWPERLIGVEVDGGTYQRGAHSRHWGQKRDAQKQNAAMLQGWALFRFTSDMIQSGEALETLQIALKE